MRGWFGWDSDGNVRRGGMSQSFGMEWVAEVRGGSEMVEKVDSVGKGVMVFLSEEEWSAVARRDSVQHLYFIETRRLI